MRPTLAGYFKNFLPKLQTRDPIKDFINRLFKSKTLLASIVIGLFQIGLWIGLSYFVEKWHPGIANTYYYEESELSFGFFLWGIFLPVIWWFYLSLPKIWKNAILSVKDSGLVDEGIESLISSKSSTILSLIISIIVGIIYYFVSLPSEIKLGRISFWFATEWTTIILTLLVTINAYVFINFILDNVVLSYRLGSFFKHKGVLNVNIFHYDKCGGYSAIGSLAMKVSSLVVIIGLWAVWYSFLPKFFGGEINFSTTVLLIYAAYIILVPLVLISLTLPVHRAMHNYKICYKKRIGRKLETAFIALSTSSAEQQQSNNENMNKDDYVENYKNLLLMYETLDSMPEWPISLPKFQRFTGFASLPGIIGLISFIFDVIDFSKIVQ